MKIAIALGGALMLTACGEDAKIDNRQALTCPMSDETVVYLIKHSDPSEAIVSDPGFEMYHSTGIIDEAFSAHRERLKFSYSWGRMGVGGHILSRTYEVDRETLKAEARFGSPFDASVRVITGQCSISDIAEVQSTIARLKKEHADRRKAFEEQEIKRKDEKDRDELSRRKI